MTTLLLAGCVAPEAAERAAAQESVAAPAPPAGAAFATEGVVFLPPSTGQAREVTEIAFEVNASGMRGVIDLRLGMRYAVDVPAASADVVAEVRDASDAVLAEASLDFARREARLPLEDLERGAHRLVLRSYGGSDGEAWGDYVAFAIDLSTGPAPRG